MQSSTWNDTNQHWIPQFLLKGFGTRKKASIVYELDKETKAVDVRRVKVAASKRHLLTDRDDEMMRGIESRAADAIDAIRKGRLNHIKQEDRQAIDKLVCAMIVNDPYSNFDAEDTRKQAIADVTKELNEALNRLGAELAPDVHEYIDDQFGHERLANFLDSRHNQTIVALRLMGLVAYEPAEGELFIVGDSPVLVVRGTENGESSLLNPGSQVILPIGSRCVLVYSWATEMNVVADGGQLDRAQVRSLNSDYYHGTNSRYIYGRDEETLRRSWLLPLNWVQGERSKEVRNGWFMMRDLQRSEQRRRAMDDEVQAKMLDYVASQLVVETIAKSGHDASLTPHRPNPSRPGGAADATEG